MKTKTTYISPQTIPVTVEAEVICQSELSIDGVSVDNLDTSNETDMGNDW